MIKFKKHNVLSKKQIEIIKILALLEKACGKLNRTHIIVDEYLLNRLMTYGSFTTDIHHLVNDINNHCSTHISLHTLKRILARMHEIDLEDNQSSLISEKRTGRYGVKTTYTLNSSYQCNHNPNQEIKVNIIPLTLKERKIQKLLNNRKILGYEIYIVKKCLESKCDQYNHQSDKLYNLGIKGE